MSTEPLRLTDEEIKKITYPLSITSAEREEVRALLKRLEADGIWRQELYRELLKLRGQYKITDIARQAVEEALFKD